MRSRWALLLLLASSSAALADDSTTVTTPAETPVQYGIGAKIRYVFMPKQVIDLFVSHAESMSNVGFAAYFVRRKGNFDIDVTLEYDNISPTQGGLWQSKSDSQSACDGGDTGQCPDLVNFSSFGFISGDVSFIWHINMFPHVQFRYGAGIGLGGVVGQVVEQDTSCPANTTIDQLDNPMQCATTGKTKDANFFRVWPVVNVQLGFRIKIVDQLGVNLEAGFRDVFFADAGLDYMF